MTSTSELHQRVARVLTEEVAPALAMDGGAVQLVEVVDGVARVRLGGVCNGCPSTIMAVLTSVEQELRRHVPEVDYIEPVI
jgi:Fe-S cluster biogenesis protein NfuA